MTCQESDDQQLDLGIEDPADPVAAVDVTCRQCGGQFQVPSWFAATDAVRQLFCTPKCRRAWSQGNDCDRIELKRRPDERGGNWRIQSRMARERDGFSCCDCGISEEHLGRQLDVHHRIPYRRFKSNLGANKLEHLVSLCASCHKRSEAQMRDEIPLFTGK